MRLTALEQLCSGLSKLAHQKCWRNQTCWFARPNPSVNLWTKAGLINKKSMEMKMWRALAHAFRHEYSRTEEYFAHYEVNEMETHNEIFMTFHGAYKRRFKSSASLICLLILHANTSSGLATRLAFIMSALLNESHERATLRDCKPYEEQNVCHTGGLRG